MTMGQSFYDLTSTHRVKGSTRCVEVLRSTFYKFLPSTHRVEVPRSQKFKSQNVENLKPIWRRGEFCSSRESPRHQIGSKFSALWLFLRYDLEGLRRDVSKYFDQLSIRFDFDTSRRTFDATCRSQIIESLAHCHTQFTISRFSHQKFEFFTLLSF